MTEGNRKLLRILLKPILRYSLRESIGAFQIFEVLKSLYVELAAEELSRRKEKLTVSRLSVITGLYRKDVKRVSSGGDKTEAASSLILRVTNRWEQDRKFTTTNGKPRVLSYRGEGSEFDDLVRSVSKDVGSASVLFELDRLKMVEKTKGGLKLVKTIQYFTDNTDRGFEILADNVEKLVLAVEQNLFTEQEVRNLHLFTSYDNIFLDEIPNVRRWFQEQGQLFHKKARDELSQVDKDINPEPNREGGGKVTVVTYSYTDPR